MNVPLQFLTPRLLFLLLFLMCAGMMGFGYFLQYVLGLEPCPLCMTQRVFITLTGLIGLAAALHGPARLGQRIYGGLAILTACSGGGFSIRQLYLQSLPPERAPACGPSVEYMFEVFPLNEALMMMLSGDGNCAEVSASFLGLSIPGWTLVGFVMMVGLVVAALLRGRQTDGA
jgi:disulfide bond formation protein DsbB